MGRICISGIYYPDSFCMYRIYCDVSQKTNCCSFHRWRTTTCIYNSLLYIDPSHLQFILINIWVYFWAIQIFLGI